MDKTTTLLQMAFVLRLECFFVCKLGRLKSPMVRKRGYECSRLKSPMVRKGLKELPHSDRDTCNCFVKRSKSVLK